MKDSWKNAIDENDLETLAHLVSAGADVNARDRYGQTGLMLASRNGSVDVVKFLIRNGADLDLRAKFNLSALMLAIINRHVEIAGILTEAGAELGAEGAGAPGFSGRTALDLAVESGFDSLAQLLADRMESRSDR